MIIMMNGDDNKYNNITKYFTDEITFHAAQIVNSTAATVCTIEAWFVSGK
jgi:hypothetical protein